MKATGTAAIVLAAGMGKRFRSSLPKVLHPICGAALISHVLKALESVQEVAPLLIVVSKDKDQIVDVVRRSRHDAQFVEQADPLGTADAVQCCRATLDKFRGSVLVLPGDGPLIRGDSLQRLAEGHREAGAQASLLIARLNDPSGYGRIIQDDNGSLLKIVEEADATPEIRAIKLVSGGIWCFDSTSMFRALDQVSNANVQAEYYLPDAVLAIRAEGGTIRTMMAEDPIEIQGANDRSQLAEAARELRLRLLDNLAEAGVTIEDPSTTYVDAGIEVGRDTIIKPLTFLEGSTQIGAGCVIGPSVRIIDSIIEDGAEVTFAVVKETHVGAGATVGPFASLRPGTRLGASSKIGTFVETKGSVIGEKSKVPHLSYIGDAEIGKEVNLGAGTITGNYDSESRVKAKTTVEDGAFTGSDTTLVAPVTLGKNSGTGAGSVVTKDVAEGEIVVGVPARPLRKRK